MITEDFVSVEIQELLNKKGFDFLSDSIQAIGMYDIKYNDVGTAELEKCCTYQMAMKWWREVNNRFIEICADRSHDFKNIIYRPSVYDKEDLVCLWESDNYKSYEEAAEAAIKYCLENLI